MNTIKRHLINTLSALATHLLLLLLVQSAWAGRTADRLFQMGDDAAENASANITVGSGAGNVFPSHTLDSAGQPGAGNFQDLLVVGDPKYVNTSARPHADANDLGIRFDGVDDYLEALRLGQPSTSEPAVTGVDGLAPEDYSGINNRGLQFWANPDPAGNGNVQALVQDTEQHGVRISAAGTWIMRYNNVDVDSGVGVEFGEWSHLMLVRPSGAAGGSQLYLNGVAIAARGGGYNGGDERPLTVGANTGDGSPVFPGTADFYTGIIDDLELFVLGTSTATQTDYGTFDLGSDNPVAVELLSGFVAGDINGDGVVNGDGTGLAASDDITAYLDNWLFENRVNGILTGDVNTRQHGDFDFDGIVDLDDWQVLRMTHPNGAGLNLGALLNARGVPEPCALTLWLGVSAAFLHLLRLREH